MKLRVLIHILILINFELVHQSHCKNVIALKSCPRKDDETACTAAVVANDSNINYTYQINGSTNVKTFQLNFSNIYKIPKDFCDNYPSIEMFYAVNSRIYVLEENAFENCKNLTYLNLQENKITEVNPRLFDGLSKLKRLRLQSNELSVMKLEEFPLMLELEELYLDGNPLWFLDVATIIRKFPKLTILTIFGESLRVNGKRNRFSCENSKNLQNILMSNNITTDYDNQSCVPFDKWHEACKNDTLCGQILTNIVENKVSEQVSCEKIRESDIAQYRKTIFKPINTINTEHREKYLNITIVVAAIISFFSGICLIQCFKNKIMKETIRKWAKKIFGQTGTLEDELPIDVIVKPFEEESTISTVEASTVEVSQNPNLDITSDATQELDAAYFFLDKETKIVKESEIGSGTFGDVFRGKQIKNNEETIVAIKIIDSTHNKLSLITSEISIMQNLIHDNVVRFLAYEIIAKDHIIVMEYVAKGSLLNYLKNKKNTDTQHLLKLTKDIALGLEYLFKENIVHCDLAARNILISDKNVAKISDFGLARFCNMNGYYNKHNAEKPMPKRWYSPEALHSQKYSKMSDIWSFGVTMYEIFSLGDTPYGDVIFELLSEYIKTNVLEKPETCPENIYNQLMLPCWKFDPNERPSVQDIIKTIDLLIGTTLNYK